MRSRAVGVILSVTVALGGAAPIAGLAPRAAASTCGMSFHAQGFLTGFPPFVGSLFYAAREGSPAQATVRVTPGCSDSVPPTIQPVQVTYVTEPGTATADADYTTNSGSTPQLCDDQHGAP